MSARKRANKPMDRLRKVIEVGATSARKRSAGMFESTGATRFGTRRRALFPLVGGVVALGSMFSMVSSGVLAVNFTASDTAHQIYTDRVVGQYAAGYINAQARNSGSVAVAQLGFQQADLYGFCAIAKQDLGGVLGTVSLVVTGGEPVNGTVTDPTKKITANKLFLAADVLAGNGENIEQMTLGQSADTLTMGEGNPNPGAAGAFGLQAKLMQIGNLDGQSYGIDLQGNINLPDMKIRMVPGNATKAACVS